MKIGLGLREWGRPEAAAALGAAFGLRRVAHAEARVAQWFEEAFGVPALVVESGRTALQLALEQLRTDSPAGREVVLPAYGCPALTDAVTASGLRPVYCDIDGELNTPVEAVLQCLSPQTLAVVMVHAYGRPADAEGLCRACRDANVALIDDAAQRVDPRSRLGTAGSFGIFSFAQSKSVVAGIDGAGGVLLVHDRSQLAALRARVCTLPRRRRRLLAWLEFLLTPRWPTSAYRLARLRKALGPVPRGPQRIAGLDAAVALAQLSTLPERLLRRRTVLARYRAALAATGLATAQTCPDDGYLARLMVRVPADRREGCRAVLRRLGVSTRLPYRLPAGVTPDTHPAACRAAAELLELPTPARLGAEEALCIARALAEVVTADTAALNSNRTEPCCTTGN